MNIGIIGGADGPTAIYIASPTTWGIVVIIAVAIAGVALFVIWRRKKKK